MSVFYCHRHYGRYYRLAWPFIVRASIFVCFNRNALRNAGAKYRRVVPVIRIDCR